MFREAQKEGFSEVVSALNMERVASKQFSITKLIPMLDSGLLLKMNGRPAFGLTFVKFILSEPGTAKQGLDQAWNIMWNTTLS